MYFTVCYSVVYIWPNLKVVITFYLDYSPMQQSLSIALGEKNTFNFMKSLIVRNFLDMQVFKNN